jgi:hypothetical protein
MWLLLLSLMGMQYDVEDGERRELSFCVRRVQPGCCPGSYDSSRKNSSRKQT